MAQLTTPPAVGASVRSAIDERAWETSDLIAEARAASPVASPFDELNVAFCVALSEVLLADRNHPDAISLGFWLRQTSLSEMRDALAQATASRIMVVPRGLAFHVTPANVDTVFVYSWILSLLAGNANIVRISSRSTQARSRLLAAIADVMKRPRFRDVASQNRIVTTEHHDGFSRALSLACDVRVVWGGNDTVGRFRGFPLAPHARDVLFPDKHSMALIDAAAVCDISEAELERLANAFYADAFWYDQGACSSPRLVVWQVSKRRPDEARRARERFHAALSKVIADRDYVAETGAVINKMVLSLQRAAELDGLVVDRASNELTWVELADPLVYDRQNCGGGLFFEVVSADLERDLSAIARREDQTATCFGISEATIRELARSLNGRGIDRFVPIGHALTFDSIWDGLDLIQEFTHRVVIDVR